MTLKQLSYETLKDVSIFISQPFNYSGNVFNEKELAFVSVKVKNNTGLTLRDVVVNITASGAIQIYPHILTWPTYIVFYDGIESWNAIKPFQTKKFLVRIRGKYDGNGYLKANVSAEIVPFARRHRASRTILVYPA